MTAERTIMDILLDAQEREIQEAIRTFLEKECTATQVRAAEQDPRRISTELWTQFGKLGWAGLCLPESVGGQSLPVSYLAILFEELGRCLAPIPAYSTLVPAMVIAAHGTDEQKQRLLPSVATGQAKLSFALQNETGNWLSKPDGLLARRLGAGFELSGGNYYATDVEDSAACLVALRLVDDSRVSSEVSLVLVDPTIPGVGIRRLSPMAKDAECLVTFDNVWVPAENLVGSMRDSVAFDHLKDLASILLASQMEGAARCAMEMAISYVKERDAFGQPIAAFQAIQHMVADMVNGVDGTQLLSREALWRMSVGLPYSVEVSQAKAFANVHCVAACRGAQQMHGGIGFIAEFDMHLWYRRVVSWSLRGGTTREHRSRVASALLQPDGPTRLGAPMHLPVDEHVREMAR
jgi:alkylation response protein AidB-like acyl-CoA dehydrogenase